MKRIKKQAQKWGLACEYFNCEDLKRHFKLTKEGGADGMVVWGAAGPMTSASAGNPGEVGRPELVKYLHEHWSPLVEEYCDP